MDIELLGGVFAVPLLIAILEVIKITCPSVDKKYIPVMSIIGGVAMSTIYFYYQNTDIYQAILPGIVIALEAVGLYSGLKNIAEGMQKKDQKQI